MEVESRGREVEGGKVPYMKMREGFVYLGQIGLAFKKAF